MDDLRECAICGKPLVPRDGENPRKFRSRKTCSFSCGALLGNIKKKAAGVKFGGGDQSWKFAGWPQITGEIDWNGAFAAHNRDPGDSGYFRAPHVPDTQSYVGNATAMLMRAGSSE